MKAGTGRETAAAEIAARLRETAKERGVTQTALAEYAGCSLQAMNRYFRGKRTMNAATLRRCAEALDCGMDYLGRGEYGGFYEAKAVVEKCAGAWTAEQKAEIAAALFAGNGA